MQLSGYFRNKLRPFMAMLLAFLTAISAIPMQPVQVFAYDGATEQAELHPWIGELLDIAYSEEPTIAPGGIAPFWDNIGGSGEQTWGRAVSFSSHPYVQNGTGISPIRYDLQRNGVNVEIYCADPHLPGPEQNSNYYVSGRMENPPPMLLNALRSGYPNNANLFLEDDYDNSDIAWAVYVTRVAVAYGFIGGRGTLTGDQAIINMARRMANGQLSVLQATRITVNGQQHVSENGEAVGSYSVAEFSMENHHLAHRPGSNPVAFSWMEGTPPGTQLRGPSGNVLATAPGLPGNNRFTTDMRFTIAVPFGSGSGGVGSAGVYIRGINNAYAGVWTANLRGDDPETRRGHQTMVFYIPVVEASAQMFFDQRSEVKIFKREMSNGIGNNQLLEGATFRIQGFYPGNPPIPIDRTATTNADGYVIFRDLPAGQFTITEIAPPSGYLLGENNVWVVNVGWGQTVEAGTAQSHTFFNYPKSSLEIMKICGITNEPLAGAVFELHDPTSGETWQATSGPNGIAIIGRGNYGNFLYPYRTYILREIVAPTGFVLINEPMTIVLSPGDENRVTIRNFRNPGLTIIKVCYDTGVALEGAVFQIEAIGTGTPISTDFSMITDAGGRIVIPYTLLDGEAERSFIIREIMPPPGFTLSEPSYQVVTMVQGRNNTVTFANRPMAYLEILKIDGDTGQPLPGAIFTVEGLDDAGNRTTWTITSNENGIARLASDRASSNPGMLVPGQTYIITEIQAPNGYVLMSGPIHHVMTHGRNTITWRNWFNPGLTIIKRCQDTQEPLAGAIFEIAAQGSGRPLPVDFPLVTDTNGRIIIPWTLFEGESERVFIVTEVVPPPGFHLSDSNRQVVTMQAGHDNTVTFYNRRKPTITIIKRDARTGEPIEGAEFNIEKIDEPGRGPLTGNPFRTDSQGRITLPFQHAGQYRITEIRAANNYWLDPLEQNRSWIINVRPNEDYVLHIENTLLPTLVITKWNMTTMLPVPLTHFRVEFEQPNSPNVVHIGDFVTDAQGMIVLPFVQPGWYRITEIFPAPGMALNANNSYRIFLNPGDNTYTLLPYLRGQGTGALSPPIESDAGVGPIDTEPNPNTSPESDTTLPDPEQSVDFPFTPVEWEAMNYSARQTFLRGQISVTDGSQWLASGGQNVFNWPLNSIVIKKVCSVTGQLLPDATFNLIHTSAGVSGTLGTVIGTYTTGPSGIIVITGLIPGSYVVTETAPPPNFTLSVNNTQTAFLAPDGHTVVELNFANDPYGSLLITKRCEVTNVPLPHAEFRVTRSDGSVVGASNGIFTTNAQGYILIPNLPPDSYVVTEMRAPDGFQIDRIPQTIIVNATGQVYQLNFTNVPYSSLIIRKFDSFNMAPLQGARFDVRHANGEFVGEFVTDQNGLIEISGLLGWFVVTEIAPPPGFALDLNPTRTIQVSPRAPSILTFLNPRLGSLTIEKVDREGAPLAGARFRVSHQNGQLVGYHTTGAGGLINISDLPSGFFFVEEVQAPQGFVISEAGRSVEVSTNNAAHVTFVNLEVPSLTIFKVDGDGNPLVGARFRVNQIGGAFREYVTTGTGGVASMTLPVGTFEIVETQAPAGFVITEPARTIVTRAGEHRTETFVNHRLATFVINKICGNTGAPLEGVVFEITTLEGQHVRNPGNGSFEFITDSAGLIRLPNLDAGSYVVNETRPLPGYTPARPVMFVVGQDRDYVITIRNYKQPSVVIRKLDGETGQPQAGVVFEIVRYFMNGQTGQRLKNYAVDGSYEFVTDSSGHIYLPTMEDGTWMAIETRPLPGFMAAKPRIFTVGINGDHTVIIRNYRYPDFAILKLDGDSRQPLRGVEFEIAHDLGNGQAGQRLINPATNTTTFVTDSAGRIPLPAIAPGRYIAIETRALPGYALAPPTLFTVGAGQDQVVVIYNHQRADWVIRKTDGNTGATLAGVHFEIARYFGGGSLGERLQNPIDGSFAFITNSAGLIQLPNLEPGTWIATETVPLQGYILAAPHVFVVSETAQNTTIDIQNFRQPNLTIRKINAVSRQPIEGVLFQIARINGERITNPQTGFFDFTTDRNGLIHLPALEDGTFLVTEIRAAAGYFGLDDAVLVEINSQTRQLEYLLVVENTPASGLLIVKTDAHTGNPLQGVEFEIRHADGRLVRGLMADQNQPGTAVNSPQMSATGGFLTDHRGMIQLNHLEAGVYHITETQALAGYILDTTTHVVTITPGVLTTLEVVNVQMAGLRLYKVDAVTGQGIFGVEFRIFDFITNQEVAGPFLTDNNGVIDFTGILPPGRYTIRETNAASGYLIDNMPRTIEFRAGMMTEVVWENTREAGQLQITKLSSADNEVNGLPAGSRLEGAVFEVRNFRTGNVVDQFITDARGVGVSRPLPLGRYTVHEIQAPAFYRRSDVVLDITIEFSGQILRYDFFNEPANVGVEVRKTGPVEVMSGQPIVWEVTNVANSSTVELSDFFMRDILPAHAVRLERVFTGTFNQSVRYSIMFRTNLNGEWRVAYDNLNSTSNNGLAFSPAALGLASNEHLTEIMFQFGTVRAGFRSVENPRFEGVVRDGLPNGYEFVNRIDVGGRSGSEWVVGNHIWATRVFRPSGQHPRTGF